MYNDTYLTLDDEMELEDAGLDLEELAEMDWDDRYDAIYEAGLDPFDYEYGFPDDEPEICVSTAKAKEEPPKCETVSYPKAHRRRTKKMSRRERRKIQKAFDDLEATLDALLGIRL